MLLYHCFHSNEKRHLYYTYIIYIGRRKLDMCFAFAGVGATNESSILIENDKDLLTNCQSSSNNDCKVKHWTNNPMEMSRGQHFGEFNLGSTVVLVFEALAQGFEFSVKPGDKIRVGEKLSSYK